MRLWRGLSRRVVAGRIAPLVREHLLQPFMEACEADPAGWSLQSEPGVRLRAHEGEAPEEAWGEVRYLDEEGGFMVIPTGRPGPCAAVRVSWTRHLRYRLWGVGWLGAMVWLPVALAAVLGAWLVMAPTLRRIRALAERAALTGAPGFAPTVPVEGREDELDLVAEALDRAHARIQADAEALVARQAALGRHLSAVAHPVGGADLRDRGSRGLAPRGRGAASGGRAGGAHRHAPVGDVDRRAPDDLGVAESAAHGAQLRAPALSLLDLRGHRLAGVGAGGWIAGGGGRGEADHGG